MYDRAAHARQRLPLAQVVTTLAPPRRLGAPFQPMQNGRGGESVPNAVDKPRRQPTHAAQIPLRLRLRRGSRRRRPPAPGLRCVLTKRAVVDPEGESANLGAWPAVSPDADFETEQAIRGRAPERQSIRAHGQRGGIARGERRSVAHVKPHAGAGVKRRQFEYADRLQGEQRVAAASDLANLQGKVALTREDDELLGYKGNHREVGAVTDVPNLP